jgi:hypothetical protein
MAKDEYESRKCRPCGGTGEAYDATMADKVASGGKTAVVCSACRGKRETLHLVMPASAVAMEARLRAGLAELHADAGTGDLPDWML